MVNLRNIRVVRPCVIRKQASILVRCLSITIATALMLGIASCNSLDFWDNDDDDGGGGGSTSTDSDSSTDGGGSSDGGGSGSAPPGGFAIKGPLSGARVLVFTLADLVNPVAETTTDETGRFSLETPLLDRDTYHLVLITGGSDIDADDDGVTDDTPTPNLGSLMAVALDSDINEGRVNATVLSDAIWRLLGEGVGASGEETDTATVMAELNRVAALILKPGPEGDINKDGTTDYLDILAFVPSNPEHLASLLIDYKQSVSLPVDEETSPDSLSDKYHKGTLTSDDIHRVFSSLGAEPEFIYPDAAKSVRIEISMTGNGAVASDALPAPLVESGKTIVLHRDYSLEDFLEFTAQHIDPEYEFHSWEGCTEVYDLICRVALDSVQLIQARFGLAEPELSEHVTSFGQVDLFQNISDVIFDGNQVTFVTRLENAQDTLNEVEINGVLVTPVKDHPLIKITAIISRETDNGILTAVFNYEDVGPLEVYQVFSAFDDGQPIELADITQVTVGDELTDEEGNPPQPVEPNPDPYPQVPSPVDCDPDNEDNCPPPDTSMLKRESMLALNKRTRTRHGERAWIAGIGDAYDLGNNLFLTNAEGQQGGLRLIQLEKVRPISNAEALARARRDCGMNGHGESCALVARSEAALSGQVPAVLIPAKGGLKTSPPLSKRLNRFLVAEATISLGVVIKITPIASVHVNLWDLYGSAHLGARLVIEPNLGLEVSVGTDSEPKPKEPSSNDKKRYTEKYKRPNPFPFIKAGERLLPPRVNMEKTLISIDTSKFLSVAGVALESSFEIITGVDAGGRVTLTIQPSYHVEAAGSVKFEVDCSLFGCDSSSSTSKRLEAYPLIDSSLEGTLYFEPYLKAALFLGVRSVFPKTASLFFRPYISAEGVAETGFKYGPATKIVNRRFNNAAIVGSTAFARPIASMSKRVRKAPPHFANVPARLAFENMTLYLFANRVPTAHLGKKSTTPDIVAFRGNKARADALDNYIAKVNAIRGDFIFRKNTGVDQNDVNRMHRKGNELNAAINNLNAISQSAHFTVPEEVPTSGGFCFKDPQVALGIGWGFDLGAQLTSAHWPSPLDIIDLDEKYILYDKYWGLFSYPKQDRNQPFLPGHLVCAN